MFQVGVHPEAGTLWDHLRVRDFRTSSTTDSASPRPVRPRGLAGGMVGRHLDTVTMSVVLLIGLGLLVAGLEVVRESSQWGFTYEGAIGGIQSQLAVTGPAAVLIALATAANVFIGAVALRFLGAEPFRGLSEMVLAGFAAAVVLDSTVLFLLGSVGLFGWPELLILHVAIGGAYVATRRRRPLMSAPVQIRVSRPAAWWLLVLAVWAGPLIVQLASPAVPFMDVLPNHVAPVEHIRIFGSFSTLTTSPSPIYGPSRLMLGYVAFLGQVTTITSLDAVLAEAAFALPLTILVALAVRRLAGELFGGSASFWALITFPLTFTFMRLPDSRGTVVVFPLAAFALCTIAAELRVRQAEGRRDVRSGAAAPGAGSRSVAATTAAAAAAAAAPSGGPTSSRGPRRSRRPDLALAFALGGAILVHPLVGLVAVAATGAALVLYPATLSRRLVPALAGAAAIAMPQALTMAAIDAPSWVGAVCIVAGVGVAFALSFVVGAFADGLSPVVTLLRAAVARRFRAAPWGDMARVTFLVTAIICLLIWASVIVVPSGDPMNPTDPSVELMKDFPHLVWLAIAGALLSTLRLGRGWIVLGCGIVGGLAAWTGSGLIGSANLTQQAVHYEVPKTIEYWLPVMLAIGAAGALAAVYRLRRLGLLRPVAIAAVIVIAVYPTTMPLATNVQIGEHRASESVGLALREAQLGYWTFNGYPDARLIIDAPRQQVVDELRAEEQAGRIGPSTRVLNIAWWFQQWVAVPVGVFTGAMETSISLHPELSIHTEGGRLYGFDRLDQELATDYGYVVLQPAGLSPSQVASTETAISASGYHQIWSNSIAIIFVFGP